MPKFRHQLTEILGQDPAEFLNSSDASATSDQVRQLVEQSLALIDKSEQKLQNRKKLSRLNNWETPENAESRSPSV